MNASLHRLAEAAHQELDEHIGRYLEGQPLVLSCHKGCAFCCHALVTISLAEAQNLAAHLDPATLERTREVGKRRLERIALEKDTPDFPTRYFREAHPCPLLSENTCSAYTHRPLACRGVLTDLEARYCKPGAVPALRGQERKTYLAQLRPHHGPEHYLRVPWRASEKAAQKLWQQEQKLGGFTVIGELATMIYLLGLPEFRRALETGPKAVRGYLEGRGVLGGEWGFWVG